MSLACIRAYFRFRGRSAHDAVELMYVGVSYMPSEARVRYAITNTGGDAPNLVQAYAESLYLARSPHLPDAERLFERVKTISEGAALMTAASVTVQITDDVTPDDLRAKAASIPLRHGRIKSGHDAEGVISGCETTK